MFNLYRVYHFLLSFILISGCGEINKPEKPNIILIMADDMGYSDIGIYGGEIHTPSLDRLGQNGIMFTQFYNGARCCPTRASLLTGLYAHQTGLGGMTGPDTGKPGYQGELNNQCVTIAEALQKGGYHTMMAGKWHVARSLDPNENYNWPLQRGFDEFFGTIDGAGSYFAPHTLTSGNTPVEDVPEGFYYTDAISDSSAKFIDHHLKTGRDPFFMYVSYTSPHWPLHALEKDITQYEGAYYEGWNAIRERRLEKMKQLGLVDKNLQLSPGQSDLSWDSLENRDFEERRMEVYAAQISNMDRGIGRILDALQKHNALDNTLILFLADNGGCAETFSSETEWIRRYGPSKTGHGEEVMFGNDTGIHPGPANTYQSYGGNWANVSNTPFRYYKHYTHEGGISSPFIMHWPRQFSNTSQLISTPAHIIDIMPTILEASATPYPKVYEDTKLLPMEGISLLNFRKIEENQPNRTLYWDHGSRAIREGNWKLVATWRGDWELYNMTSDRSELNDLSSDYPEVADSLATKWEAWANRVHVFPKP